MLSKEAKEWLYKHDSCMPCPNCGGDGCDRCKGGGTIRLMPFKRRGFDVE